MKTDFLIIGQGLAGTMLAWNLLKEGAESILVDSKNLSSASKTSAGIINPLTGRQFALSWEFENLLREAEIQYRHIEEALSVKLFEKTIISRAVMQTKGLNDLLMRLDTPAVAKWVQTVDNQPPWPEILNPASHYVHIHGAKLNTDLLIQQTESFLSNTGRFVHDHFLWADVQFDSGLYHWKDITAKHLVWCGGAAPPFQGCNSWPVIPLKGQILRIRIPGVELKGIVKHHIFIVGAGTDVYWAGATHEPNAKSPEIDDSGFELLKARLDEMLRCPWDLLKHESALRPTVKDRRPILGTHNSGEFPFFVFTGLGTKGASLAPYCAKVLVNHMLYGAEIPRNLDFNRF